MGELTERNVQAEQTGTLFQGIGSNAGGIYQSGREETGMPHGSFKAETIQTITGKH